MVSLRIYQFRGIDFVFSPVCKFQFRSYLFGSFHFFMEQSFGFIQSSASGAGNRVVLMLC